MAKYKVCYNNRWVGHRKLAGNPPNDNYTA
jgi:hypothetical protein